MVTYNALVAHGQPPGYMQLIVQSMQASRKSYKALPATCIIASMHKHFLAGLLAGLRAASICGCVVTYTDSAIGITCSGVREGKLTNYLITAKIVARCSDGSLLQGTLQDTLINFPPGSPVPSACIAISTASYSALN